ncbi:MAG: nicotinamidase [Planctomycetaceae bacterium]|nr:nicotinamidase [Planctomycetaceae bacterium]
MKQVQSLVVVLGICVNSIHANSFEFDLRFQQETSDGSGRFHRLHRGETWKAEETAVIVCDVWDLHHCLNAVRRLEEFGPRLNALLKNARERGATIIHSPSDCMPFYESHAARTRAMRVPVAKKLRKDIATWCSLIPGEERAVYPIDQSDGGEDDHPKEHAAWAAKLKSLGRNPGTPWKRQSEMITIDADRDFITDRGDEVWNILEHRGIKNVILTGVHTNMCVIGRPFGLRQMVRNGKNVVLVRDMTDTMYNPQRWPYVSHFTGTDLIISHIERYVCPTITSDQFLGGKTFRLKNDKRPHVAIVTAEQYYHTNVSLPDFALRNLGRDFRVSYVFADDKERNTLPGIDVLKEADVLVLCVRRRVLPLDQMQFVRDFIESGKPVVGVRTAHHAFVLADGKPGKGLVDWPGFDREVFGCDYQRGHGPDAPAIVGLAQDANSHELLNGITDRTFRAGYSAYKHRNLDKNTKLLLSAKVADQTAEPVAWTYKRKGGGRSFYVGLGHPKDFEDPTFDRLLTNAIYWAAGRDIPKGSLPRRGQDFENHWTLINVPGKWSEQSADLKEYTGTGWYRCVLRLSEELAASKPIQLKLQTNCKSWLNGHALSGKSGSVIDPAWIAADDANLLVVKVTNRTGLTKIPTLAFERGAFELEGRWQFRAGDDASWSNMPLPAKFGTSTDIVFEPRID